MGRRRHRRRRRTSGRSRTPNALDSAESKPTHKEWTQTETSLNNSGAVNADAGQCQRMQPAETVDSASSAESCGSGNENNLEKFAAKASKNAVDSDNACCEFAGTDSIAGGKGGTQENRDEACPVFLTDTTAGHRGGTQDNRDEACSKCEDSSVSGGIDATKDSREEACSKCAADVSAGGKGGTQDKVANRERGETPDIGSAREAVREPRVHTVTAGDKDAEMASVTDPDVHMATLTDSDVVMVSVSDPDVTMRTVSETDAAAMPVSVSLMCLKCHSHLDLQICGVHTVGPAQRVEAITLSALAQSPEGVSGEVQGFSVAPSYPVPQASPGIQMCNASPSGRLQLSMTSSCSFTPFPSVIQTIGTASAQQQPSMAAPPPSLIQVPWEIQMCDMTPSVQHQLPVNAWWPNSAQVPPGFQMHGFVDGRQRLPCVAVVPSSGAIFNTQMCRYPSSGQLQPSMMTAPALQVPVPSAVEMHGLSTPNQPLPSMAAAPSIVFQGLPAAPIREFVMPDHFLPPYYMTVPPQVQPPLYSQVYNLSANGQPQYSLPPALQAALGPCVLEGNVNGQPQSSMAVPPAASVVQMPAGVQMCGIPTSAHFQLPTAISPVTQFPPTPQVQSVASNNQPQPCAGAQPPQNIQTPYFASFFQPQSSSGLSASSQPQPSSGVPPHQNLQMPPVASNLQPQPSVSAAPSQPQPSSSLPPPQNLPTTAAAPGLQPQPSVSAAPSQPQPSSSLPPPQNLQMTAVAAGLQPQPSVSAAPSHPQPSSGVPPPQNLQMPTVVPGVQAQPSVSAAPSQPQPSSGVPPPQNLQMPVVTTGFQPQPSVSVTPSQPQPSSVFLPPHPMQMPAVAPGFQPQP